MGSIEQRDGDGGWTVGPPLKWVDASQDSALHALQPRVLEPLDLESVRVVSQTTRDEDGRTTLNLQADGGDLKRTLAKLYVESLMSMDKVRKDPNASGRGICWIPQRLRTAQNIEQVVAFEFGEIPASP